MSFYFNFLAYILPLIALFCTINAFHEKPFYKGMEASSTFSNVGGVLSRVFLGWFVHRTKLRATSADRRWRCEMTAITLLIRGWSCTKTLIRGGLSSERTSLTLSCPQVLIRKLMSKTGRRVIGTERPLTLWVRR